MQKVVLKLNELCVNCGFCEEYLHCLDFQEGCIGCGACIEACPAQARYFGFCEGDHKKRMAVIDGKPYYFSERLTILQALEDIGYSTSYFPDEGQIYAPCRTGGCWSCAVLVNGELKPACVTPLRDGMEIITDQEVIQKEPPLRLVGGYHPHPVGGVGTPYWLKPKPPFYDPGYIEIVAFTQGCILRCPTCQNWIITYSSRGRPITPEKFAEILTAERELYGVERITFSGGESTINKRWLIESLKSLRKLNSPRVHLHVDTNSVMLTPEYIDKLMAAGMTDIGADLKAIRLETFRKITGLKSIELAERLMKQAWNGVEYLLRRYREKVFIGVGIPYNSSLITIEEIKEIAGRLLVIDPDVQITLIDYRPEFRQREIIQPDPDEIVSIWKLLKNMGLKCVTCQTSLGIFGP